MSNLVFKICEDIDEAFDIIVQIFENKKASVNINESEISLIIKVDLPGGKMQEAKLTLNKKLKNKSSIIEELSKRVNQLEKENIDLKNEIKSLKNETDETNETETENHENVLSIKVKIRSYGIKTYKFEPSDTLRYLIICVKKDFKIYENIILRFNNLLIDDYNLSFEDYKIYNNSTVNFIHYKIGGKYYVETFLRRKTITLHLEENDTIEKVKEIIEDRLGKPIKEQSLFYNDIYLNDNDKTIKDYNIWNESILNLL